MYFGRKNEIEKLNNFYADDSAKAACIYGRVGIGKSSLLKQFISDKKCFFYTAYATTAIAQTATFARVLGMDEKKLPDIYNAKDRLLSVLEYIESNIDEKTLLVIDQYHFFAKSDSVFDQTLYDFIASRPDSKLKLIICGDSYLQMKKLIEESKSLWKNLLSLCIELGPMSFYEAKEYFRKEVDRFDLATLYGITGGIPSQMEIAGGDVTSAINNIFFSHSNERLLTESIIASELREMSYYNYILETLAAGHNRVNKISEKVNKPKDIVVPYMNTLMSIGIVTKENPVTEKTNRKKTRYSIINSFDRFWYQFIVPNMDLYYANEGDNIIRDSIEPNLNKFMEPVFVSMCKEYLVKMSEAGKLPFVIEEIGNWWQNDDDKQTSEGFDLVALARTQDQEAMIFGQCHYSDQPIGIANLKELIDLTKRVKGKKNVFYLVFSKNGFHENTTTVAATIKNIILVSLEDICSID